MQTKEVDTGSFQLNQHESDHANEAWRKMHLQAGNTGYSFFKLQGPLVPKELFSSGLCIETAEDRSRSMGICQYFYQETAWPAGLFLWHLSAHFAQSPGCKAAGVFH